MVIMVPTSCRAGGFVGVWALGVTGFAVCFAAGLVVGFGFGVGFGFVGFPVGFAAGFVVGFGFGVGLGFVGFGVGFGLCTGFLRSDRFGVRMRDRF